MPERQIKATCVHGCGKERDPSHISCDDCWKLVPRAMKLEFWAAYKAAEKGRGWRKNGRNTPRLAASIRAIVHFLAEKITRPFLEAQAKALPPKPTPEEKLIETVERVQEAAQNESVTAPAADQSSGV